MDCFISQREEKAWVFITEIKMSFSRGYRMSISIVQAIILLLLIAGPLLFPLLTKKWTWLTTMTIGYVTYILWGVYLHTTSDITEYGTGYGIFIVPYIFGITILGAILERNKSKSE